MRDKILSIINERISEIQTLSNSEQDTLAYAVIGKFVMLSTLEPKEMDIDDKIDMIEAFVDLAVFHTDLTKGIR
jgi:hypothetical protein